jgi:hypothetical protein
MAKTCFIVELTTQVLAVGSSFGDAAGGAPDGRGCRRESQKAINALKTTTYSVLATELMIMARLLASLIGAIEDTEQASALKMIAPQYSYFEQPHTLWFLR